MIGIINSIKDLIEYLIKKKHTGWIKINFHNGDIAKKIEQGQYVIFDKYNKDCN